MQRIVLILCVAAVALAAPAAQYRGTSARRRNRYQSIASRGTTTPAYSPQEAVTTTAAPPASESTTRQYEQPAQPSPTPSSDIRTYRQRAQPAPAAAAASNRASQRYNGGTAQRYNSGANQQYSSSGTQQYSSSGTQQYSSGANRQYSSSGTQQYSGSGTQQYSGSGVNQQRNPPVPIVRYQNAPTGDGGNQHAYETGNGIQREEGVFIKELTVTGEDGKQKTVRVPVYRGSFKYQQPDGTFIEVQYEADETGFHAVGDSIPQALQ